MKKLISAILVVGVLLFVAAPQVKAITSDDVIIKPMSGGSTKPPINERP